MVCNGLEMALGSAIGAAVTAGVKLKTLIQSPSPRRTLAGCMSKQTDDIVDYKDD